MTDRKQVVCRVVDHNLPDGRAYAGQIITKIKIKVHLLSRLHPECNENCLMYLQVQLKVEIKVLLLTIALSLFTLPFNPQSNGDSHEPHVVCKRHQKLCTM